MIYTYTFIKSREYQKLSFFYVICRREYYAYRGVGRYQTSELGVRF